jgi:hypothetical protein
VKLAPLGVTTLNFDIYRSRSDLSVLPVGDETVAAPLSRCPASSHCKAFRNSLVRAVLGANMVTKR